MRRLVVLAIVAGCNFDPKIVTTTVDASETPAPDAFVPLPDAFICPARYEIAFGGHKYVGIGPLDWNEAQTDCASDGGQLIEVETAAEDAELKRQLESSAVVRAWIGLRDPDDNDQYNWIDGSDTTQYANFDDQPGTAECVHIGTNAFGAGLGGRWYTAGCTNNLVAVCECAGL